MKRAQRTDMLKTLARARATCRPDPELYDLGEQLDKAVIYLTLLVAGERRCSRYEVVNVDRLCSAALPLEDRLKAIEEAVRDVYGDFEDALAKEKYEDRPTLTLGDRMVLNEVDDAVWMISGMLDSMRSDD